MTHQTALTEQTFTLVDALYSSGMTKIVISPGSRSTPLAIAAELHPNIQTYIHPDERGAGFFALGISKKEKIPVGLLCTSGTAASNYVPSVAEAGLSHIPLVILTSDRPHELRNVGAPQAINQTNMFQNFVRWETELPIAEDGSTNISHVEDRVLQAKQYLHGITKGPVHFNIPIREPLMPDIARTDLFFRDKHTESSVTVNNEIEPLLGQGLMIIGETDADLSNFEFEKYKNITVIMDPRVHARIQYQEAITTHDLIFMNISDSQMDSLEAKYDFILRVGESVTSKSTNQFLKRTTLPQILVSEFIDVKPFPKTPLQTYVGDIGLTLERLLTQPSHAVDSNLLELDHKIKQYIDDNIEHYTDEGRYMYKIIKYTDTSRHFFVSSSMPIRDFERYDTCQTTKILSNRGANGIDGVVSSAFGSALNHPMTLLIGDIAMNHDLNGLLLAKLENIHGTVICFNNNGGNIFSYLPQSENQTYFERLFGTPLNLSFKHAAKLYDFKYYCVEHPDQLTKDMLNEQGRVFIEIMTERNDNLVQHNQLKLKLKECVRNAEI